MTAVQLIPRLALSALLLCVAACSSGGGGGDSSTNAILGAVQDLAQDPDGLTTVITFQVAPGALTTASFEADGGQSPQTVAVLGAVATVTWDARVTPSHGVRAIGSPDFASAFTAVTTSDSSAPTFTITSATQVAGLGDDEIELTFSGPRVVPDLAEDPASWVLRVNNVALDLSGSSFSFDANAQTLSIVLGPAANLHAAFTLAAVGVTSVADVGLSSAAVVGAASGDLISPSLLSAEQNLAEDEYGRVVDFTFDEAMDPVFSTGLSRFGVPLPAVATSVEQPSPELLRVSFSGPIVPGVDQVTLTGLVDAHGNPFPNGPQAVFQPSPVANAFDGSPAATTVENAGGDTITIVTTQALHPGEAIDPANWTLSVDGNPIDLSTQTLAYDFLAKTLTIELDFDMLNGDAFEVGGNGVLEVDGQAFSQMFAGTVAGDAVAPTVSSATQNRTLDPTGRTVDVRFSEDVRTAEAQNTANYALSGGVNVLSATRLQSFDVVRLVLDAPAVPGDVALDVSGIDDLAGNAMAAPQLAIALVSTDLLAPSVTSGLALAVEGALNDTVTVVLDDLMVEADVEDPANWTVESPLAAPLSLTGTTISYDAGRNRATLTFGAGSAVALRRGEDFRVTLTNTRDIGGNAVVSGSATGVIGGDLNLPSLHSIHRHSMPTDRLELRFSEPCGQLTDLYHALSNPTGTRYVLRDSGGVLRGHPLTATALDDGLGVLLEFGIVVAPSDTLDVIGVEDLAGNPLFPVLAAATVAEDGNQGAIDALSSALVTVSGEDNDVVTVSFDRPMSPWGLLAPERYELSLGGNPLDLSEAQFEFDGDRTVTITLRGDANLVTGSAYDLSVNDVLTAQGVLRTVADTAAGIVAGGDSIAPSVAVGQVRLDPSDANSLLLEVDEAVDVTAAETPALYDYAGGNFAVAASRLGPRTVRASFAVLPALGQDLEFSVTDLAGNVSGSITRAVAAADLAAPLVASVSGTAVSGRGGDWVDITFDEPVDTLGALNPTRYSVQSGAATLDLAGSILRYDSSSLTVRIFLAAGRELTFGAPLTVTVDGVSDHSGNTMAAPVVAGGSVAGDSVAPTLSAAFVALRVDPSSRTVDVRFDEDVDDAFALDPLNWSASGGQSVLSVGAVTPSFARVTLSGPLLAGQSLSLLAGLTDLAGNAAGPLSVVPVH